MTWTSLASRVAGLPRVLAGPLLRKVTPTSVTVWLAMQVGATVTLTVQDDKNVVVMRGQQRSVAVGRNLHIVAVTAQMSPPFSNIAEGIVYRYDVAFRFDDNSSANNLAAATRNALLAYPPWTLPSFALPPQDLNLLRLLQGSCRKPHADGTDMLPFMSQLIEQSASNAFARPHQLLLTGDQIYADDVAAAMLMMLTDASTVLLDWEEVLPVPSRYEGIKTLGKSSPLLRRKLLTDLGFTSVDLESHLLGLGEYISMYLFVWSDVLWPATLPAYSDILEKFRINLGLNSINPHALPQSSIEEDIDSLSAFAKTLPTVRRLLANVPSYMIFDDHEVTDDWNMTRSFCENIYGTALGQRVVQNGLLAYSLCQHWGNVPEAFLPSDPTVPAGARPPGAALLALIDTPQPTSPNAFVQKAADYDGASKDIRALLGIHDRTVLRGRDDYSVFHDVSALRYDFSVEGVGHQVIFTDTRTWRSFPQRADGPPQFNKNGTHLLAKNRQTDQFKAQILDAPDTRDRLLFVVLTTNFPPVQPIRAATRHDSVSNHLSHYPDVYEAWDLPSDSFDRMLVALTSKLPVVAPKQRAGAVILLSGDVHFSFASRLMYRATKRYQDDADPHAATAVIAQLVASALKKQTEDTLRFQREGYYAAPHPWLSQTMIRHTLTEGYVGWSFPKGAIQVVGSGVTGVGFEGIETADVELDRGTVDVSRTNEQLANEFDSQTMRLVKAPHYRYRFDYLLPTAQFVEITAPSIPPLPPGSSPEQRKDAARAFDAALKRYRFYNLHNPPRVVGVNNFGEIKLDWGAAASRRVNHIVRWLDPGVSTLKSTTYSVRLDLNSPTDKEFPDIKAEAEP